MKHTIEEFNATLDEFISYYRAKYRESAPDRPDSTRFQMSKALNLHLAIERGYAAVVPYHKQLGTPLQAIEFALTIDDDKRSKIFLIDWDKGDLRNWPEYRAMIAEAAKGGEDEN